MWGDFFQVKKVPPHPFKKANVEALSCFKGEKKTIIFHLNGRFAFANQPHFLIACLQADSLLPKKLQPLEKPRSCNSLLLF